MPPEPTSTAERQTARVAVAAQAYDAVASRAPAGVTLERIEDGAQLEQADFLVPRAGDRGILKILPDLHRLKVVQVLSAGTDWIENHVPAQATLCSARGARDAPVAEWVVGALLGASTGLLECARERDWRERHLVDLSRWTVLVIGMGSIGRMLEERLGTFEARVIGVASHARDGLHGVDELPELLPQADAVVVLTPLTDATRGLIDAGALAALRDGTLLVNAARGPVVDTEALLAETESGRLRAVLDVTDPEPLPAGHGLWSAPGVLAITPHIAGDSPAGHDRAADLAGEQLARWCAGQPLENVVRTGSERD
ncbi:MAG: NAD(P)-dependent oxidoreductase [Solirubrobacteraceae bacterium]